MIFNQGTKLIFLLLPFLLFSFGCSTLPLEHEIEPPFIEQEYSFDYENNTYVVIEHQITPSYNFHVQGIDNDEETRTIYHTFTDLIVISDYEGTILVETAYLDVHHLGDPEIVGDYLYAPHSLSFNTGSDISHIYKYNKFTLVLEDIFEISDVIYGAGAITYVDGYFYVAGGIGSDLDYNLIYRYDLQFNLVDTFSVDTGYTFQGIQALYTDGEYIYAGVKEGQTYKLRVDEDSITVVEEEEFPTSYSAFFVNGEQYYCNSRQVDGIYGSLLY